MKSWLAAMAVTSATIGQANDAYMPFRPKSVPAAELVREFANVCLKTFPSADGFLAALKESTWVYSKQPSTADRESWQSVSSWSIFVRPKDKKAIGKSLPQCNLDGRMIESLSQPELSAIVDNEAAPMGWARVQSKSNQVISWTKPLDQTFEARIIQINEPRTGSRQVSLSVQLLKSR